MADDRPQYQHGVGTIGGTQFHWGSGTPGKYWSVPYGDYPVTPDAPVGAWAKSVGAIPVANNVIPDSLLHRNRIGIMIHSGSANSLDELYTQGCFKVAPAEWPAVRTQILAEAKKGPLYLHVQPGGVASFTNTKTLEQAAIPTASAPGPVAGALAKPAVSAASPYGNPFLDSLAQIESNNQNIYSEVDKDYPGQPGSRSQGHFQIDTPTWQQFAAKAGVDVTQFPSAMNAPPEVQARVASLIPLSRFGPQTREKLAKQYPGLDLKATIGDNAAKFGGGAPATAVASAAPATTAAPAAPAAAPAADKPWWSKLTQPPVDKEGKPIEGAKSPVEKAVAAFTGSDNLKARMDAQASAGDSGFGQGPGARNVSPGLANIAQTYGQTLNSYMQPLTWGAGPPRLSGMAPAGSQAWATAVPGLSLNSVQAPPEGLGYGIASNYGLG